MTNITKNTIPAWGQADLPVAPVVSWRNWTRFIGPGIVMMGVQIGGGEWLFGAEITARYGGGLMWIATVSIILQLFYNIECGRYALYCGEPIFTGFMRTRPGPLFWIGFIFVLNLGAFIPGLSTHAAAMIAALYLDRPPTHQDGVLVMTLSYVLLGAVALPVLVGGKVYNTLQGVMAAKVFVILGFCLFVGVFFVSGENWLNVFSGFLKFGTIPVTGPDGREATVNAFQHYFAGDGWPVISMINIALLGAFAGFAGGGGLSNSTYSNYVREKGWGMGGVVGAIPSIIGGGKVKLSHVGKVFPITPENLGRWRSWFRYVLTDQIFIWFPGCIAGMAFPALLSLQFAPHSALAGNSLQWAQSLITADGIRHFFSSSPLIGQIFWILTILVGLTVMLPSQMAVVDSMGRRWTDIIWSGSRRVQAENSPYQVKYIYFAIILGFVFWSLFCIYLFSVYGSPRLMTVIIANLNNLALGLTSFHLLWINRTLLPPELRPRWYSQLGVIGCGIFNLGLAAIVFWTHQWPVIKALW